MWAFLHVVFPERCENMGGRWGLHFSPRPLLRFTLSYLRIDTCASCIRSHLKTGQLGHRGVRNLFRVPAVAGGSRIGPRQCWPRPCSQPLHLTLRSQPPQRDEQPGKLSFSPERNRANRILMIYLESEQRRPLNFARTGIKILIYIQCAPFC